MFEELGFMVGFALFSVILSYLLLLVRYKPVRTIILGFLIIGIAIHECFHILMCIITRTPIRKIRLVEKTEPKKMTFDFRYNGRVEVKYPERLTFLQGFLIGFAPMYLSFWLFFFLLYQLNHIQLPDLVVVLYVILMISLTLSAAPSLADVISVFSSFAINWSYSLYQLGLLGLSILTIWLALPNFQPAVFQEILIYGLIGIAYFSYKYSFKLLKISIMSIIKSIKAVRERRHMTFGLPVQENAVDYNEQSSYNEDIEW